MLSDRQIRSHARPNSIIADGGGLYLRVSVRGSKTFLYRTRKGGRARYVTLGSYPSLTLQEARRKAGDMQGRPLDHTVRYAVESYLSSLQYLRKDEVKRRLEKDIVPELGSKKIGSITTGDISSALQKIVDRGSPVSANRTLADVRHVFDYAYGKGWIHADPSTRITRKVVGGREKSKEIVVSDDDLRKLIAELRTDRWESKTRAGIAACLLTGQRASECLGMKEEVKRDWWTIPKHRTNKTDLPPQKVYLVPLARYLSKFTETCDHRTLSRALNRAGYDFSPHSLRHTMKTRMADMGVLPHISEKCLHHKLQGVLAVYDHAEYLEERRDAWHRWYCYLRRLTLSPPRVST